MNLSRLVYLITGVTQPRRKPQPRRRHRPNPLRSRAYKAWIRTLPCIVPWCSFSPVHAAHTGFDGGMGVKAADWSCVPLCALHHWQYHQIGRSQFASSHRLSLADEVVRCNARYAELRRVA